jgi:hypothetical protein
MRKISYLKPLIFLLLFNYLVIVFGSHILYIIQVNVERILRPSLPRLLIGAFQVLIGSFLILLWIFVWLRLYKYLFAREISKFAKN